MGARIQVAPPNGAQMLLREIKTKKDKTATAFGADPFFTILIACSARCADR